MFVQSLAGGGDLGELLLGLEEAFAVFPVFLEAGAIADDGDAAKLVAVVEEFSLEFSAFLFFKPAEGADEFLLAFAGLLFKLRDAALGSLEFLGLAGQRVLQALQFRVSGLEKPLPLSQTCLSFSQVFLDFPNGAHQ